MMTFTFLGTGSAFSTEHLQSNALLEVNGKRLLIDAGGTVHLALKQSGIKLSTLDAVYVTHLHADHWGGAEYLAYGSCFDPGFVVDGVRLRLRLFSHPDVRQGLWHNLHAAVLPDRKAQMHDFFDVQDHDSFSFQWQGVSFEMPKATHALDNGQPMPCYGLKWSASYPNAKAVCFSADTVLRANDDNFGADVIFHDCETGPMKTGVHARYEDLLRLPADIRSKMTLYHYNDGPRADAVVDGFAGWAQQGASIEL